jgi:hypothetical protein
MIAKIILSLTSFAMGATLLFGGMMDEELVRVQSPPGSFAQEAEKPDPRRVQPRIKDQLRRGDDLVYQGLVLATVSVTGLSPVEVMQALEEGDSLAEITESAGESVADVLSVYDETVEYIFSRVVENECLPASTAEGRIEWYQEVGRKMVDQPGLRPRYPGLHQLHVGLITAAARIADIKRWEMQAGLHECQSLDELLAERGHSGQEAVDLVMERINSLWDTAVENGMLDEDQRQDWQASLQGALEEMVFTPGLHLAGSECAP